MKKTMTALAACVALGAWGQATSKDAGRILSSASGRYVFGQISDFRRDQYMLDTQTGRLWRVVSVTFKKEDGTDGTYDMLEAVSYDQKPVFPIPK
jgi:hypothetical protein